VRISKQWRGTSQCQRNKKAKGRPLMPIPEDRNQSATRYRRQYQARKSLTEKIKQA
jgi:hypothetical protein